jgi:acylphosphatase
MKMARSGQGWQRQQAADILGRELSAMTASATQRCTVYYSGHVQGVGFRYTTQSIARGHVVTGFVHNLPDGRVELVAEGKRREIDAFLSDIRDRMSNHIRDERCDVGPATGEFSGFDIRH